MGGVGARLAWVTAGCLAQLSLAASDDDDLGEAKNILMLIASIILACVVVVLSHSLWVLCRYSHHGLDGDDAIVRGRGAQNWKINYSDLALGDLLGKSALGSVRRAKFRGFEVVVKALPYKGDPSKLDGNAGVAQLLNCRHPSLCLFMGIATDTKQKNKIYVVSQFMNRGSLFGVLRDPDTQLSWAQRVAIALDVSTALNYMHNSNPPMLHQHLNSMNVVLDDDFTAKVTDYGLDRIVKHGELGQQALAGSPLWVAPELFKKNRKPTSQTDVYSFGVILFELLYRCTPFQEEIRERGDVAVLQGIADGTIKLKLSRDCPTNYSRLVRWCTHREPAKRPSFEMIIRVLTFLAQEGVNVSKFDRRPKVHRRVAGTDVADILKEAPWAVDPSEIKFTEEIGKGSFGRVWLADFRGKQVAVKRLSTRTLDPSRMREFLHELSVMCSLRHPNTVLFMGACLQPEELMIVMEYCENGNLFENLNNPSVPLNFARVMKVLLGVAEGVSYLHQNDPPLLHRDLKSLNILVDRHWNVKVSDFGLTGLKAGGDAGAKQLGSSFWLSPEAMESQQFSVKSDAYAFGMIAWEVFVREVPFGSMNPHQAALAVIAEDKRPDIPPYLPANLRTLIEACWERDPAKRPAFPSIVRQLRAIQKLGLPRIELKGGQLWSKRVPVHAFRARDQVVVFKSWGTGESKQGDYVIVGEGNDVYTCDNAILKKTYRPVGKHAPLQFKKVTKIYARQIPDGFLMSTLEGMEHGDPGDFLAQNPIDGEQWPIPAAKFRKMYELDEDQSTPYGDDSAPWVDSDDEEFKRREQANAQTAVNVDAKAAAAAAGGPKVVLAADSGGEENKTPHFATRTFAYYDDDDSDDGGAADKKGQEVVHVESTVQPRVLPARDPKAAAGAIKRVDSDVLLSINIPGK